MKKHTLSAAELNKYITQYAHAFTPGSTMSYKQFRRRFTKFNPKLKNANPNMTREASAYTGMYTALNKVLAHRGLYMKSVDYHQSFMMIEDPSKKLKNYDNRIKGAGIARTNLATGIKRHRSRWSALSKSELTCVAPMVTRHVPNY